MDYHISATAMVFFGIAFVWDLVWRGFALWRSGRNSDLPWVIVLLVVNSVGILPIIYLTYINNRDHDYVS